MMSEPTDPMTPLMVDATVLHELYISFQKAGFSQPEALALVMTALQASIARGTS